MIMLTDKFNTLIVFSINNIKAIFVYDTEIHIEYLNDKESIEILFESIEDCKVARDYIFKKLKLQGITI